MFTTTYLKNTVLLKPSDVSYGAFSMKNYNTKHTERDTHTYLQGSYKMHPNSSSTETQEGQTVNLSTLQADVQALVI